MVTERILIIDQLNVSSIASEAAKSKLVTQKFTDILPTVPLLYAMDDFILPIDLSENITIMSLSFTIIRQRRDTDPDSITVIIRDSDPNTGAPDAHIFCKTIRAPNNPPLWHNDSLGVPEIISINITQGEACTEHPSVLFDLKNTSFLPRNTPLWIGFYVTGARSYVDTPAYAENIVFWCTTIKKSGNNETEDGPYYFIDEANILGKGFSNWTAASKVESMMGFTSVSRNMAWSLTFLTVVPTTYWEILVGMNRTHLIAIILGSLTGLFIFCICLYCACRVGRRCRFRRGSSSIDIPFHELSKRSSEQHINVHGNDIYLDTDSSQSIQSHEFSTKSSPSGKYLHEVAYTPVRTRPNNDKKSD